MKTVYIFWVFFLLLILDFSLVFAKELEKYSFFGRLIDGFRLFFSAGESRVDLLLEIKEKELNSAIVNANEGNIPMAVSNLNNAINNIKSVQGLIKLDNAGKIASNANKTISKLLDIELIEEFDDYLVEEKVVVASAELMNKTYDYCKGLALRDYDLMLSDESCNPVSAIKNIKTDLESLKDLNAESRSKLMVRVNDCINNLSDCDCSDLTNVFEKANCEEVTALALKCDYQDDNDSCSKLESINFVINKSRMDDEIVNEPSMRDSIPQCYDLQGNFLESCGKITKVMRNGLVNYLIEQEINETIESLTNSSISGTIDIDGLINQTKQGLIELNNSIGLRSFAPGTWETNNSDINTTFIKGNETSGLIVIEGNTTGDLTPEISNLIIEGDGEGTGDLTPEINNLVIESE